MNSTSTNRKLLLSGVFVFAGVWVFLMALLVMMIGGGAGAAAPPEDANMNAKLTSLDRGKNFEISLAIDLTTNDGKTLEGLTEQSFEVYEDGVPVAVHNFMEAGKGSIRLALVFDATPTMERENKYVQARQAARALLRMLRDQSDHVGLYFFNAGLFNDQSNRTELVPIKPLDPVHRDLAWYTIFFDQNSRPSNLAGTPMLGTVSATLDNLAKVSGRKVMIVLTDGRDTDKRDYPEKYTKHKQEIEAKCKENRISIYTVSTSTGADNDAETMIELANLTGGKYYAVDQPSKLTGIFEEIGKSLQDDYTMSYFSPNPVDDGTTRRVTVNVRNGLVGKQVGDSYSVAGLASTGSERTAGGGGGLAFGTILTIFATLAVVLGALSFVPSLVNQRAGVENEAAPAAAVATAPSAAMTAAKPAPRMPAMPPAPKRPKA